MTKSIYSSNPYTAPGRWYKGSLHIHSTASDGERTPRQVVEWYRQRGYHFLALTDHDVLSTTQLLAGDMLAIGGIEVEGFDPASGLYHLLGLGAERAPDVGVREVFPLQEAIRRVANASRLVALAHPYWSGQMSKDLLDVEGFFALEVYNGGCDVDDCKGYSNVHWDDLLATGRRLWGIATDDVHWRTGDRDAGLGWVWVKAPELDPEAILDSLEQGAFYSSCGPEIHDVTLDGSRAHVRCSPVAAVDFVGSGPFSRRVSAPPGQTLVEASHTISPQQRYLRVACQDLQGRWAWNNPIFFDPNPVA